MIAALYTIFEVAVHVAAFLMIAVFGMAVEDQTRFDRLLRLGIRPEVIEKVLGKRVTERLVLVLMAIGIALMILAACL